MSTHYGGQALIEGVLIRGKSGVFAAVRAPDGQVITREERLETKRTGLRKLPVVRGVLALRDTLSIGTRMLVFSADVAAGGTGETLGPMGKRATFGAAFGAASIFVLLPSLVSNVLGKRGRAAKPASGLRTNLTEGAVRIGFLLSYLGAISRLKDVQRIFAYHGAEHKSISALEAEVPLTPENVQRFETAHPRCGTAFLMQSMVTSTIVYGLAGNRLRLGKVGTRLVLTPVVAGISFEVLQFNARHLDSRLVRLLNTPGMLMQRLTTRQPSDDQVEVAIRALQGAIDMDKKTA